MIVSAGASIDIREDAAMRGKFLLLFGTSTTVFRLDEVLVGGQLNPDMAWAVHQWIALHLPGAQQQAHRGLIIGESPAPTPITVPQGVLPIAGSPGPAPAERVVLPPIRVVERLA